LPEDTQSVIAKNKIDEYFEESDGIPAILVFQNDNQVVELVQVAELLEVISEKKINGVKEVIPLGKIPPEAAMTFFSEDETAAVLPLTFEADLDTKEIKAGFDSIYEIVDSETELTLHVTGPAGIAVDTSDLFSRADLVLLFSTVG